MRRSHSVNGITQNNSGDRNVFLDLDPHPVQNLNLNVTGVSQVKNPYQRSR